MKVIRPIKITPESIVSTTAVDTEQIWLAGSTYAKAAKVIYDSLKDGPSIYQSVVDGNKGNTPDTSPDDWVRVGPTNRWAMFDGSASTLSESQAGFSCSFKPGEMFDSLAFFEVYGVSMRIWVSIEPEGEIVFDRTLDLLNDALIVDGYAYCFEPFDFIRDGLVKGLPPYGLGATVHIEIFGTGRTGVGEIVVGTLTELGCTEFGAGHGIRDYSRAKEDDFGNVHLQRGAYAKRANWQIMVEKERHRYVSRILAELRGLPTVFIGSEDTDYEPLVIFGFIKNWDAVIPYPTKTLINVEIQGLK